MAQSVERRESPRPGTYPAISELRRESTPEVRRVVTSILTDMNVPQAAADYLWRSRVLGTIFAQLGRGSSSSLETTGYTMALGAFSPHLPGQSTYDGSFSQNMEILRAISEARDFTKGPVRASTGEGGTTTFIGLPEAQADLSSVRGMLEQGRELEELQETPIVIIGAGIAGLTSALMLKKLGFSNITILDKTGQPGGLWQEEAAQQVARNNPSSNMVFGVTLPQAKETSEATGHEMLEYAQQLYRQLDPERKGIIEQASVLKVETGDYDSPGNKEHVVYYQDAQGRIHTKKAPIVVSAIGNSEPLSPQLPGRMTTNKLGAQIANPRWQELMDDTQLRQLAGQKILLVGLGNTTIQAVQKINAFNTTVDEAKKIKYVVATHYPMEDLTGNHPAIFRDSRRLTGIAGDLDSVNQTFTNMLEQGSIVFPGVTNWEATEEENGKYDITLTTKEFMASDDNSQESFAADGSYPHKVDAVYSFIGYQPTSETLAKMGLQSTTLENNTRAVPADWNGEFQAAAETQGRAIKGFIGVGGILKGYVNPNAETVSGINYQVMFGLALTSILRAAEFHGMTKGWPALEPLPAAPVPSFQPTGSGSRDRERDLVGTG